MFARHAASAVSWLQAILVPPWARSGTDRQGFDSWHGHRQCPFKSDPFSGLPASACGRIDACL